MTEKEVKNIIQQGENETVEFKSSFNKTVIETIVAFSNTKGGKVVLGCNDDKNIVGVSITEETIQKWINEIKQNTVPAIIPTFVAIEISNKSVVIIDDIVIRSPLILAVDEALDFIKKNIRMGYVFGGEGLKRKDR